MQKPNCSVAKSTITETLGPTAKGSALQLSDLIW